MLKKLALGLTLGSVAGLAAAQAMTDILAKTPHSAYVQDGRGVIARNPFGLCWRTGYWTPADAVPGCDGELAPQPKAAPPAPPPKVEAAPPPPAVAPPPPPAPPKRCDATVTLQNDATFAFNKSNLTPAARQAMDMEILPKLAACANVDLVMVTGHADRIGTQQYNQRLSDQRAETVAAYLKANGVSHIETLGVGKTQPVKACGDKLPHARLVECLAPNRRVVVEIKGLAK